MHLRTVVLLHLHVTCDVVRMYLLFNMFVFFIVTVNQVDSSVYLIAPFPPISLLRIVNIAKAYCDKSLPYIYNLIVVVFIINYLLI